MSAVIGFPHGTSKPETKIKETQRALDDGAKELDVVINYGRFLGGDTAIVRHELKGIVRIAHRSGALVKAILETCYYSEAQITETCRHCVDIGVDFVKTSTGFGPYGAETSGRRASEAVKGSKCQVKASGGINSYAVAARYLDLGSPAWVPRIPGAIAMSRLKQSRLPSQRDGEGETSSNGSRHPGAAWLASGWAARTGPRSQGTLGRNLEKSKKAR